MDLELIIAALRQRCPAFENRITGAANFKVLPETSQLAVPCAYVLPLDDNAERSRAKNATLQDLRDGFAIVVAISNKADEKGHQSTRSVRGMRKLLWGALLGWQPKEASEQRSEYDAIEYDGGSLLQLDRARLWYQFEFSALMTITDDDGWRKNELAALPHFDGITLTVDGLAPEVEHLASIPTNSVLP